MHYCYIVASSTFLQFAPQFFRWFPLIVVAIILVQGIRIRSVARAYRPGAAQDPRYRAWREDPLTPVQPPAGLALDPDEAAYYSAPAAITDQPLTSTALNTADGSPPHMSVRLNMNVRINSSSDFSQPATVSSGTLTITNKRLIYGGGGQDITQSFDVPGTILVPFGVGVGLVSQQGGEGLFFRTGDPVAGIVLLRAMQKTLTTSVTPLTTSVTSPVKTVTPLAPSVAPPTPSAPSPDDVTYTPSPDPPKWHA